MHRRVIHGGHAAPPLRRILPLRRCYADLRTGKRVPAAYVSPRRLGRSPPPHLEKEMTKLLAALTLALFAAVPVYAADEMGKDAMSKDSMSKDGMKKDGMKKDGMKKDGMKDGMKKGDSMKKGDAMKKEDGMTK
jgi:pentapeptide MXKDX repeat protein